VESNAKCFFVSPNALCLAGLLLVLTPAALLAQAAAPPAATPASPTIKLFIKGSAHYATPADAPVKSALLVATSKWENMLGTSPQGVKMFSGDVVVVLSSRTLDCTSVFERHDKIPNSDFDIAAGQVVIYPATDDFQNTPMGRLLADTSAAEGRVVFEPFGIDMFSSAKRVFSKDKVKHGEAQVVLTRDASGWKAQVTVRDSRVTVDGTVPLTLCPVAVRTKNVERQWLNMGTYLDALMAYRPPR
jgi:hypothetical protein